MPIVTEEMLKKEYEQKLADLRQKQSVCNHEWGEVEYDPEIKRIPVYKDRFFGSDYIPELIGFEGKIVDRWSRTCKKCGKVEHTKELVATKYEPKF